MILAALVAASLIVPVSVDYGATRTAPAGRADTAMSAGQKSTVIRPLVSSATECIARTVSADPRFRAVRAGAEFNDLIVESVGACIDPLRSMIDAYDRLFGEGTGETFFMGPYLDALPAAVNTWIEGVRAEGVRVKDAH